jgi:adhesin HecA-like repeat protein
MTKTISGYHTHGIALSITSTVIDGTFAVATGNAIHGSAAETWRLINNGYVYAYGGAGIQIGGGADITNTAGAVIYGREAGIVVDKSATIANAGSIYAYAKHGGYPEYSDGIFMGGGGAVTNSKGGLIEGAIAGIDAAKVATITNAGTIIAASVYTDGAAAAGAGIFLNQGGMITNSKGGVITGGIGIEGRQTLDLLNQGLISITANYGVNAIEAAGTMINAKSGTIAGGIEFTGGTIINAGQIKAAGYYGAIDFADTAGSETLVQAGGRITGAIANFGPNDTIDEAGITITSETFADGTLSLFSKTAKVDALTLDGAFNIGAFTLRADGHGGSDIVLGSETFTGTYAMALYVTAETASFAATARMEDGVSASARGATIVNHGTITFPDLNGSALTLNDGALTNTGLIEGYAGVSLTAGTIINAGAIIATATAALYRTDAVTGGRVSLINTGLIKGSTGLDIGGGSTVTNAGTISGSRGTAIQFGDGAARFVDDPGATLIGGVTASLNPTINSVLELASASASGHLAGIGETILGFNTITFDAGAAFTIQGAISGIAAGQTIENFAATDAIILDNFSASSVSTIAGGLVLKNSGATITLDIATTLAGAFAIHAAGTSTTITAAAAKAVTSSDIVSLGALSSSIMNILRPEPQVETGSLSVSWEPHAAAAAAPVSPVPPAPNIGWMLTHPAAQAAIPAVTLHSV